MSAGHTIFIDFVHDLNHLSRVVQTCFRGFGGVGTLEPVDVCVCQMSFWTKSVWTNFGQLFDVLDKFGQRFLGLSSNFGREFEKHYIIVETRF